MYDQIEFGKRLKQLRRAASLTQEQLADELNVGVNHVGKMEIGRNAPSIDLLIQISEYFGVSVDYLLKGQQDAKTETRKAIRNIIRELRCLEQAFE